MNRRGFLTRIGGALGITVAAPTLLTLSTASRDHTERIWRAGTDLLTKQRELNALQSAWLEAVNLAPKAPHIGPATAEDVAYWSRHYVAP